MRRIALLHYLAMTLLSGCRDTPRLTPLPAGSAVIAFGNSITFGTGANPGEDYASRLAASRGWQIENAGIPGDPAEAGRNRIRETLDATRPALGIVEIGGNDFRRRRPETAVKEDLRAIIGSIRQSGAPVVLVAVLQLSLIGVATGNLPDAKIYADLASEEKLPVVEDVLATVLADPELKADPIHPNAQGYAKMAEGITEKLTRVGLLKKP